MSLMVLPYHVTCIQSSIYTIDYHTDRLFCLGYMVHDGDLTNGAGFVSGKYLCLFAMDKTSHRSILIV